MKKKLKITICILAALAIIGVVGYNITINYAEKALIKTTVNSMLESGALTLDELQQITETDEKSNAEPAPHKEESEPAKAPPTQTPAPPAKQPTQAGSSPTPQKKKEIVDKFSDKLADSISSSDKKAMIKLITSRLSASDIKYLAGLLSGGLTREEREAAYKLAKSRFSGDELNMVSMYYHRYKTRVMSEPDYPQNKK